MRSIILQRRITPINAAETLSHEKYLNSLANTNVPEENVKYISVKRALEKLPSKGRERGREREREKEITWTAMLQKNSEVVTRQVATLTGSEVITKGPDVAVRGVEDQYPTETTGLQPGRRMLA